MRMQLRYSLLFLCFLLVSVAGFAQTNDTAKVHLDDITLDFVSSYYSQDGNNSPVTGGRGTEQLTDFANVVTINIPTDTIRSLNIKGGIDFYSSASSDNINNPFLLPNHISGASGSDARKYLTVGKKVKNNQKRTQVGYSGGVSQEFDVLSLSIGGSFSKMSKDKNKELSFHANYFYDTWTLIYPYELRGNGIDVLSTNIRKSLSLTTTASSVINKKMQASISSDIVYQSGLLSTPFHRVYFQEQSSAKIEYLPASRLKLPLALRFNYSIRHNLILRTYFRYYWDSWNINAQTYNIELPVKISNYFTVYPFYRHHTQTAAKYFAAYKEHSLTEEFYTSDYDLAGLSSNKYGLGVRIAPLYGIGRFKISDKRGIALFKSMDIRYSQYKRSNGLTASIISFGLNFTMAQ